MFGQKFNQEKLTFMRISAVLLALGTVGMLGGCTGVKGFGTSWRTASDRSGRSDDASTCTSPFSLAEYLSSKQSCYQVSGNDFDTVYSLDKKRMLSPWIPCNRVQIVSMASDGQFDFKGAIAWLSDQNRFKSDQIQAAIENPQDEIPGLKGHPALNSPHHEAVVSLIRGAEKTIFLNALIFGGAWGAEIAREIMLKQNDGVEVLILRDTENFFAFAFELDPVWYRLVEHGVQTDGLTVLRADIHTRSMSAFPFGFERVLKIAEPFVNSDVSLSGKSDHTKLLIVDGLSTNPKMFVTSKNTSDYNLVNYDEGAIVKGPAAAAAQVGFMPDILLAEKLAVKESEIYRKTLISEEDKDMLQRWYQLEASLRDASEDGLKVQPFGQSAVRLSENNGDDSVRNAEMNVLQLVVGAQTNIRMYSLLSYNPMVARALADAAVRLGPDNVRVMADATFAYALNVTFYRMLKDELRNAGSQFERYADQILRWRSTVPTTAVSDAQLRPAIMQQQHTKTIVVDDEVIYLGSTNFDVATLSGSFREFSVAIKDRGAALASAETFDALWKNERETMSTEEVLSSGGPSRATAPPVHVQEAVVNLLKTEQARRGSLNPRNFVQPEQCN
jgi:phosphatidylserine/phosphatidylglycerophosphate/cardiolipin synthase-like enzyme